MSSSSVGISVPSVLTIAGSDSGGGAGIQADIKTIHSHGCHPTSVITALTAQNTLGVQSVMDIPPEFVGEQLQSILSDLPPQAIKTGMLASSQIISLLASILSTLSPIPPIVIDPVTISTSNHTLLPESAVKTLCVNLLGLARVVTPNIVEAEGIIECLTDGDFDIQEEQEELHQGKERVPRQTTIEVSRFKIKSLEDMIHAASTIQRLTPPQSTRKLDHPIAVLIKGGHLPLTAVQLVEGLKNVEREYPHREIVWSDNLDSVDGRETYTEVLESHRRNLSTSDTNSVTTGNDHTDVVAIAQDGDESNHQEEQKYVIDILLDAFQLTLYIGKAIHSTSTHGTGCTLSAAIASELASGRDLQEAVRKAIRFTQMGIEMATKMGGGFGPLDHGCLTTARALPLPTKSNPHPFVSHLIKSTASSWRRYVRHPFVDQLGKGTLKKECFKHYIIQDWLYLKHYARAHSLGGFKATEFEEIKALTEIALHVAKESQMHVEFCKSFGVEYPDLQSAKESPHTSAYARYILDIGMQGDLTELLVAVASCLIGYGEVGLWLARHIEGGLDGMHLEGNAYRRWIEDYSGKEFQDAVHRGIALLENRLMADPPSPKRLARLTEIWANCVELEIGFWDMGLDLS